MYEVVIGGADRARMFKLLRQAVIGKILVLRNLVSLEICCAGLEEEEFVSLKEGKEIADGLKRNGTELTCRSSVRN